MVTTTILLMMAQANVTISWRMTTNDEDNDADISNDVKGMTMGMIGGGGMWRGNVSISWTRGARGA
jgi:hypothetical protein